MTHAIERTSSKGHGQKYVGRCIKCGEENLPMEAARKPCPADGIMSNEAALLNLIEDQSK